MLRALPIHETCDKSLSSQSEAVKPNFFHSLCYMTYILIDEGDIFFYHWRRGSNLLDRKEANSPIEKRRESRPFVYHYIVFKSRI